MLQNQCLLQHRSLLAGRLLPILLAQLQEISGCDVARANKKQRISIARAMLKKSSIILLDEATSSLDSETETKIQDALKILTKDRTTIVIAHRLSTILNSNKIYVIDSGKIVDNGKHEDLLINSKIYKNFHDKQFQR